MRIPTPVAAGVGLSTFALYSIVAVSSAEPATAAPPGQTSASTSAEILHLSTLAVPGTGALADAGVGTSTGTVDAAGKPRTTAVATNLGGALADRSLPDLLAKAEQQATPDHFSPDVATTTGGAIAGLANVNVSTASALARWTGGGSCPAPGEPLTQSSVSTADVSTTDAPNVGTLLALPGTVSTEQSTTLSGGSSRSVVSTARGTAADVRLFDGQLEVSVADAPTLTATASGTDGGAHVDWNAPAVTVTANGQEQTLPADGSPVDFTSPDNPLLHAELSVGQLTDVSESDDGTAASGEASVLHVQVALGGSGLGVTVLDTDLFPLSASATAPDGGVQCGAGSADSDGDGLTDTEETSGVANTSYDKQPTDPDAADSDGDGLSDGDEVSGAKNDAFGSTPTDPNEKDTDGGSVSDGDEVAAGTDPNNPADDVGAGGTPSADDPDGDGLSNQQETEAGTNPANPDSDGDELMDGEEVNETETDPIDPDTDGDRLTDGREVRETSTDANVRDTDHDGLSDGREVLDVTTDPNIKDTDGDGLGDGREVKHTKTKPKRKDTDGDGIWDGKEVRGPAPKRYPGCHTNPKKKDSDRDLLNDGRELKRTHTNPCDKDSDDGGVSDGKEVQAGSDPNDSHSTPKNPRGQHGLVSRLISPTG